MVPDVGLLERISDRRRPARSITTIDDYAAAVSQMMFGGVGYPLGGVTQTMAGDTAERVAHDLPGYARVFATSGPVFSCMLVRQQVFSAVRFRWQRITDGKPSDMFGTPELGALERPWPSGTTQDLLNREIQYADLAGNAFAVRDTPLPRIGGDGSDIVTLRPDWVDIVLAPRRRQGGQMGWRKLGYVFTQDGRDSGNEPVILPLNEVSHFAPIPDPLAAWRGMSWLTPVVREIQNDGLMTRHQRKFFENAATPNMVATLPKEIKKDDFRAFVEQMDSGHKGIENAYKTLYLGGGADVTIVGQNFDQMKFTDLTAASETRIASAAGVPPIIAGFSKGLESATYSNYGQARRRFADGTMHPLWQQIAGSLEPLVPKPALLPGEDPSQVRLWYDPDGVPFLREDEKDHAQIQQMQAATIASLVREGYTHDSVIRAVEANDWRLLRHTGLYSVQLHPPGSGPAAPTPPGSNDDGDA